MTGADRPRWPSHAQEARRASAVVTGVRGRGPIREHLLGSVSLSLTARAPCPVVVVRGRAENREAAIGRIVLGVGGATAAAAVRYAFSEAAVRGCEVEAVRTWRPGAQSCAASAADRGARPCRGGSRLGSARRGIGRRCRGVARRDRAPRACRGLRTPCAGSSVVGGRSPGHRGPSASRPPGTAARPDETHGAAPLGLPGGGGSAAGGTSSDCRRSPDEPESLLMC